MTHESVSKRMQSETGIETSHTSRSVQVQEASDRAPRLVWDSFLHRYQVLELCDQIEYGQHRPCSSRGGSQ